jgi:hypothetical protein
MRATDHPVGRAGRILDNVFLGHAIPKDAFLVVMTGEPLPSKAHT